MPEKELHECQCPNCQGAGQHPDQPIHRQMNLLFSRLDEQQRLIGSAARGSRRRPASCCIGGLRFYADASQADSAGIEADGGDIDGRDRDCIQPECKR